MATLTQNRRYSLKYSSSNGTGSDVLSRTISGFNIRINSSADTSTGPYVTEASNAAVELVQRFTVGTMSNVRWVTEQELSL